MSGMEQTVCCFTGHRKLALPESVLQGRTEQLIEMLYGQGVRIFKAGGALGFDTLVARAVLNGKAKHPDMELHLILPHPAQTAYWQVSDQEIYDRIRSAADKVIYTADHYFPGCMQMRNRRLVDDSGYCISYFTEPTGGTAYTVHYARRKGLILYNVANDAYRTPILPNAEWFP
jgi:uncharacterized phage-like protein YoqJ